MTGRSALAMLVAALATTAFAGNVPDPGQKGSFEVGFTSFLLTDATRPGDGMGYAHRPIPVNVWYPVDPRSIDAATPEAIYPLDPLYAVLPDAVSSDFERYGLDRAYQEPVPSSEGPFPLLVFSPGWGAAAWLHTSVGTRLASHGFVVAVVYHFGDQWWPWEPPFDPLAVASYNRPRDVSFALSDLLQKNATPGGLLHGVILPDRVAAGGWSLGGYASMVLAGGDDSVCDTLYGIPGLEDPPPWTCVPSPPDPRVKAIVPLDGSNQVLHFAELARIEVPAMGVGEEWDAVLDWQARQHAAFSSHPAYRVDVLNTNHQAFSDLCEGLQIMRDYGFLDEESLGYALQGLCEPFTPRPEVHRLVSQYTVAFLKANLAREPGYQNRLTPGWALTREPYAEFFVTEKKSPHSIGDDWPDLFVYFPHQPGSAQARGEKDPKVKRPVRRAFEQ